MKNKHVLAIIPTIFITLPSASYAMGIGDINVSSKLGEPFRASVNISSAPTQLDSNCFKLNQIIAGADGAMGSLNANLALKKISGDDYKLVISTYRPINEPVLDLVLSSECGTNSTRQYTVLLDPSMNDVAIVTPEVTAEKPKSTEKPSIVKSKSSNNKRHAKKNKPSTDGRMSQTILVPAQALAASLPASTAAASAPKLVISGGTSKLSTGANTVSLMLDNNLHDVTPPTPEQLAELSNNAESDDITALKLQIAQLEKRNLELEAAGGLPPNTAAANPALTPDAAQTATAKKLIKPEADEGTPWLLYLLIAALIGATLFAFDFMRRRKRRLALATDLAAFNEAPFTANIETSNPKKTAISAFGHSSFGNSSQYLSKTQIEIENDTKDDVLREVEVFMALGRNNLAIKLLQANVREFPKDSPSNWLLLLDLLKQENLPTEYADTTDKCQRIFNIYVPPFGESDAADNSTLEDHPHIEEKLEEIWGTNHMAPFLGELIYNSRPEARKGFRKNVYWELLLLHKIALDRDQFDDTHVPTAMNSASRLDDTALKAKFDEVYSQTGSIEPNVALDNHSVANDLDAEITKLEAVTSKAKDADFFDLDMSSDFDALAEPQLADTSANNVLDIPLEFDIENHSVNENTLEMELAKFAEEQAAYEKSANQNSSESNSLGSSLSLELPSDELIQAKPKKKSSKKAETTKADDKKFKWV